LCGEKEELTGSADSNKCGLDLDPPIFDNWLLYLLDSNIFFTVEPSCAHINTSSELQKLFIAKSSALRYPRGALYKHITFEHAMDAVPLTRGGEGARLEGNGALAVA
jgi:hypothetical protein